MSWVRLDLDFYRHPKFTKAGPAASWLWFRSLCYTAHFGTNGVLNARDLPAVCPGIDPKSAKRWAGKLLAAKLWDLTEAGDYKVHDFEYFQPDSEAWKREGNRRRQSRLRHAASVTTSRVTERNVTTDSTKNVLSVSAPPEKPAPRRPPEPADPRVKEFLEWFQTAYKERRNGADYLVAWPKHSALIKRMLHAVPLERLKLLARMLLNERTEDQFIMDSDRGIEILSAKFNWLSDRLAEWEAKRGR